MRIRMSFWLMGSFRSWRGSWFWRRIKRRLKRRSIVSIRVIVIMVRTMRFTLSLIRRKWSLLDCLKRRGIRIYWIRIMSKLSLCINRLLFMLLIQFRLRWSKMSTFSWRVNFIWIWLWFAWKNLSLEEPLLNLLTEQFS